MTALLPLRAGSDGDEVRQVQERLNELEFSVGTADGDFGRRTTEAVQAFQADYQLHVTGEVDEATWGMLFSSHAEDPTIAADDPTDVPTADRLVELCLHQVNDRYVFGAVSDHRDPSEDEFDCAELISWGCGRLGVEFPGYSVSQIDAVNAAQGHSLTVAQAASIRGALLFRRAGHNGTKYNHVALSLGTGEDTIEAMSTTYGVCVGTIGNRFTDAGYIPGIHYS